MKETFRGWWWLFFLSKIPSLQMFCLPPPKKKIQIVVMMSKEILLQWWWFSVSSICLHQLGGTVHWIAPLNCATMILPKGLCICSVQKKQQPRCPGFWQRDGPWLLCVDKLQSPFCPPLHINSSPRIVSPPSVTAAMTGMWHGILAVGQAGLAGLLQCTCQNYSTGQLFWRDKCQPPPPSGARISAPCPAPAHLAWRLEGRLCCQSPPLSFSVSFCCCSN